MEQVANRTISNESITIDGKHFLNCTLVDCLLLYSGNSVIFERTQLTGCRHVFFGEARSTVHYLQSVGLLGNRFGDWREYPDLPN